MAVTLPQSRENRVLQRPRADEALLADITRRIVDGFDPYAVILFGSYAWGKPTKDSDIDLLVILDSDKRRVDRAAEVRLAAEVRWLAMDLLVYTPDEIATRIAMRDLFILRILEKGRWLYERGRPWEQLEGHPTMTLLEEWVQKAEADYKTAVQVNRRRSVPLPDIVVLHCQQCAEKYLKAFLIDRGESPEKTHSLAKLLDECAAKEPALAALRPGLEFLDKFSVDPRYPGYFASVEQGNDAIAAARSVRKTVRKLLKL